MKRGYFIVCFVLVLLFISGASQCSTNKTVTGTRYIGGTDGLVATFADGEPPASVLDAGNEQFAITLSLENKGENDIKENDVKTTLFGISQFAYSLPTLTKTNTGFIEGKRKENNEVIKGGQDSITYDANYRTDIRANFINKIGVNYCYNYKTKAVADVCLRKDVSTKIKETDACKIVEPKTVSSSGAPIQITSLSERTSKVNEVSVTFTIENKGKGNPFYIGSFAAGNCEEAPEKANKDYVYVSVTSQEPLVIRCSRFLETPAGRIRLVQNQISVTCKIDTTYLQSTTYTAPLDITVDYVYKDYVSKDLTIENAV